MDSTLLYLFDLLGTAVFAISGVLLAGKLKMDVFGVSVLATVTAIGGGTIRDMALGATPVFWMQDTLYLWVIIATSILGIILLPKYWKIPAWVLPVFDAVGLAVFVGIGVEKALLFQDSYLVAVLMGIITGCGGGIIRDVLAREIPMVLRTEIYATACMLGGGTHIAILANTGDAHLAFLGGMIVTLVTRLAALRWNLSLPTFTLNHS